MSRNGWRAWLAGGLVAIVGCGESSAGVPPVLGGDGDGDGDGQFPGGNDDAGTGDGGVSEAPSEDNGGPAIEVLAPMVAEEPLTPELVVGSSVKVQCKITERARGRTIDSGSLYAQLYVAGVAAPLVSVAAVPVATIPDAFEGTLSLADVPHGRIYVGCAAADIEQRTNMLTIPTFFDRGPALEITSPQAAAYFRKTRIAVVVKMATAELSPGDSEAAIAALRATVNGNDFALVERAGEAGTYEGEIDLTDVASPPVQLVLDVAATNKRTPVAAVRRVVLSAPVDARAPKVDILRPVAGAIVGNRMLVQASIVDENIIEGVSGSGVDPESVRAVITGAGESDEVRMEPKGDIYEAVVPSIEKFTAATQIKVNVLASDNAGNEPAAASADGIAVYPDLVPPFVSLDPENVREVFANSGECSVSYDPLGFAPPNDGDIITDERPFLRVLAWDRAFEAPVQWHAMTDPASVEIHTQSDPNVPMLVTGPNGKCDPKVIQSSSSLKLSPITASAGQATDRITEDNEGNMSVDPAVTGCELSTRELRPTDYLCNGSSDMTRVLRHTAGGTSAPSVIFAVGPLQSLVCTGNYFSLDRAPGWKCVVARGSDNAGNESVSTPLRLCFSEDGTPCDGPPPSCTDGCTLDDVYASGEAGEGRTGFPRRLLRAEN